MLSSLLVAALKFAISPIAVFSQWLGGNNSALNITAAGIVKKSANPAIAASGTLYRLVIQNAGVGGTLTLNDTDTVADAAAANQVYTVLTANLTVGQVVTLDWPFKTGIVASVCSGGIVFAASFL